VDDVATVAARVAAGELDHAGKDVGVLLSGDDAAAPIELAGDGGDDEDRQCDAHQRIEAGDVFLPGVHAHRDENDHGNNGDDRRHEEIAT